MSGIKVYNKVYDGTTTATLSTGSVALEGVIEGDSVFLNADSAVGVFEDKNVGTGKIVTISGLTISSAKGLKYSITQPTTIADITARPITVTVATDTKTYDGTTSSSEVPAVTSGSLAAGDTATWNQVFDTRSAGTSKTLIPAGTINDGNGGNNYDVTLAANNTGVILQKILTVSGITASSRVYDGTTNAAINTGSAALEGVIEGDSVFLNTASAVGTFDDKNAGTGKIVTVSFLTISGADAHNYLTAQPTTTADITAAVIRVATIRVESHSTVITNGKTAPTPTDNTDFGSAAVAGGNIDRTFTIKNTGDAALTLSGTPSVKISGANAADFTVTAAPVSPLAVGGQTTFTIRFDPSAPGRRSATVSIASNDSDKNPYTFAIQGTGEPSAISVISPNGGENWVRGLTHTINWTASNVIGNVTIELLKAGSPVCTIACSIDAASGDFAWDMPLNQTTGSDYQVRITSDSASKVTSTSSTFSITIPPLAVVAPGEGTVWQANTQHAITWTAPSLTGELRIELLKGGMLVGILSARANLGCRHYEWTIPYSMATGSDYRILINSTANPTVSAVSGNFTINGRTPPSVILTSPVGGEVWQADSQHTIVWTSTSLSGYLRIELLRGSTVVSILNSKTSISSGRYVWTIPGSTATGVDYRVRITNPTNLAITAISDNFTIKRTPP